MQTMSIGYMVQEAQAMVWRGPMVQGALLQMLNDVAWPELDILVLDLPPGTGDIQLTIAKNSSNRRYRGDDTSKSRLGRCTQVYQYVRKNQNAYPRYSGKYGVDVGPNGERLHPFGTGVVSALLRKHSIRI